MCWCIFFLLARHLVWAAVLYGLSVHMKIYPITYALPIALSLRAPVAGPAEGKPPQTWKKCVLFLGSFLSRDLILFGIVAGGVFSVFTALFYYMWGKHIKVWFSHFSPGCCTWHSLFLIYFSASIVLHHLLLDVGGEKKAEKQKLWFLRLVCCGCRYGWSFLHETYLYHLTRRDIKHNFSPYFYMLYLTAGTHQSRYGGGGQLLFWSELMRK